MTLFFKDWQLMVFFSVSRCPATWCPTWARTWRCSGRRRTSTSGRWASRRPSGSARTRTTVFTSRISPLPTQVGPPPPFRFLFSTVVIRFMSYVLYTFRTVLLGEVEKLLGQNQGAGVIMEARYKACLVYLAGKWPGMCDLYCDGRAVPVALTGAAQLRADKISSCF